MSCQGKDLFPVGQPATGGSLWVAWRTGWLSPSDHLQAKSPGVKDLAGDGVTLADLGRPEGDPSQAQLVNT